MFSREYNIIDCNVTIVLEKTIELEREKTIARAPQAIFFGLSVDFTDQTTSERAYWAVNLEEKTTTLD